MAKLLKKIVLFYYDGFLQYDIGAYLVGHYSDKTFCYVFHFEALFLSFFSKRK